MAGGLSDLRAATRLAVDATRGVTDLVEAMHRAVSPIEGWTSSAAPGRTSGLTGLVYGSVRGVTRIVGSGLDLALGRLAPMVRERQRAPAQEAVIAALNGVLGDFLAASGNALATPMQLHSDGRCLSLSREALREQVPRASSRIVVLVHGLCMNDLQWHRDGHDHGAALARDLGMTPLYLRYNTGLHVSANGAALAALLEELLAAWPVEVRELTILAHSMGGLVTRSALHTATLQGLGWPSRLTRIVFLGTPHHGAPLERGGNALGMLLGLSRYTAPFTRLARLRSAGITDLRHGSVVDADWQGRDRFAAGIHRQAVPLPDGVACFAIAATTAAQNASPRARLPGDGLVPVDSALGRHRDARFVLDFPPGRQWIAHGTNHLELQTRPEVYARIREWCLPAMT